MRRLLRAVINAWADLGLKAPAGRRPGFRVGLQRRTRAGHAGVCHTRGMDGSTACCPSSSGEEAPQTSRWQWQCLQQQLNICMHVATHPAEFRAVDAVQSGVWWLPGGPPRAQQGSRPRAVKRSNARRSSCTPARGSSRGLLRLTTCRGRHHSHARSTHIYTCTTLKRWRC